MVKIHYSYTGRVNPSGVTPVLTRPQIRFAQEFVPIILSCTVLSDEAGVVTRDVVFKPGMGPKPQARETVKSYYPSWVDFIQENNTVIKNIISAGPSLQDDDLHMTYAFELDYPGLEEGSKEAEAEAEKMTGMAKMAVEKSIETIRAMVVDGRIKE